MASTPIMSPVGGHILGGAGITPLKCCGEVSISGTFGGEDEQRGMSGNSFHRPKITKHFSDSAASPFMVRLRKLEWVRGGGSRRRKGAGGEARAVAAMGEGNEKAWRGDSAGGRRETAEGTTNLLASPIPLPASPT